MQQMAASYQKPAQVDYGYGKRIDGTLKGQGWFGPIQMPTGDVMTEISGGHAEDLYPLVNPLLTEQQIEHLRLGGAPTQDIWRAGEEWKNRRKSAGLSPFADNEK